VLSAFLAPGCADLFVCPVLIGPEDRLSVPLGAARGSSTTLEIRGQDLDGAYAVWFEAKGIGGQIKKIEPVEADNVEGGDGQKQPKKWFRGLGRSEDRFLRRRRASYAEVGIAPGISAGHPFVVTADPVVLESRSAHGDPEHAQPLEVPTLLAGSFGKRAKSISTRSMHRREKRSCSARFLIKRLREWRRV